MPYLLRTRVKIIRFSRAVADKNQEILDRMNRINRIKAFI